ncbi:MAG TPA: cobalamin-independent methionine synthase II family protein [Chloroflexota bacterium]|jgi:5-methyltetrahydropteroyltriglutamate--homocysteine methyltransferase
MKHSTERILTTHTGSLPRPHALLDLMKARIDGEAVDDAAYDARLREAVAGIVREQIEHGVDVVTDGEQSKLGFSAYVNQRLAGFEERPRPRAGSFAAEMATFPEYYEQYFARAMTGGRVLARPAPLTCVGPISYRGQEAVRRDIANLQAAVQGVNAAEAFMPAIAASHIGNNEYYRTEEEFLAALADAMHEEYQAIVDAGFLLQLDDPGFAGVYSNPEFDAAEQRRQGGLAVEAINHALRGIPAERVRFHTCYGINEGPRVHDAPLSGMVDMILKINAGAYSFEAANARHEHEYHVWENVKLPEGKVLIPGVITHASNIVEHPELIAERITRYAERVGRENVIASTDCGFSSQATYTPEVQPRVMWAKFQAMAEGARLASEQLWR